MISFGKFSASYPKCADDTGSPGNRGKPSERRRQCAAEHTGDLSTPCHHRRHHLLRLSCCSAPDAQSSLAPTFRPPLGFRSVGVPASAFSCSTSSCLVDRSHRRYCSPEGFSHWHPLDALHSAAHQALLCATLSLAYRFMFVQRWPSAVRHSLSGVSGQTRLCCHGSARRRWACCHPS